MTDSDLPCLQFCQCTATSETTFKYSKSKFGTAVLHYQGYDYLKHVKNRKAEAAEDDKVRWICREKNKKVDQLAAVVSRVPLHKTRCGRWGGQRTQSLAHRHWSSGSE